MNNDHIQPKRDDITQGSIADEVLSTIETKGIEPDPKWKLALRNEFIWALGSLSVAAGGLAVAIIIFSVANAELGTYRLPHDGFADFIFDWVPLVWIAIFILFACAAHYNFRHTSRGYRYPVVTLIAVALGASTVLGACLYATGMAAAFDQQFGRYVPLHRPVAEHKRLLWINPERGMLAGEVIAIDLSHASFSVRDFRGDPWEVTADAFGNEDWYVLEQSLSRGALVRIAGLPVVKTLSPATTSIVGCALLPWEIAGAPVPPPSPMMLRVKIGEFGERKIAALRSKGCESVRSYLMRPVDASALPANR